MEILPQLLVNALIAGSIYALASAGMTLTYGLLKILNFAHGHMMMVGVYFFYLLHVQAGLGIFSSAFLSLVFSIVLGAFCLRIFVLPFHSYSFLLTLVSTMALSTILESLVSMIFGVNVKSLPLGQSAKSIEFHGVYVTPIQILIILSSILLLGILAFVVHNSALGRRIRALSENSFSAEALGVNRTAVTYGVFILSTLLTTYAGVMIGYETNMQPTMGTVYTIKSFAAMMLGGLGNLWGTVCGSYLLGLVENLSIGLDFGDLLTGTQLGRGIMWVLRSIGLGFEPTGLSIPAGYKDAFAFTIILLVLLFRPEGLFTKKKRRA